ncbi:hypothetical protein [Marinicrinis lubricantis]|uniref:Hsp20/alpha crystallin family protein n=1 Tax=Marinicrinis lubricantis TaxID=2086470 RepID=A0ABW1IQN3_9BACL
MSLYWLGMIKELEQLWKQLEKSEISKQWIKPFAEWMNTPKVEVLPDRRFTKIWIEAPGLTPSNRKKWAYKVIGDQLLIRGILNTEYSAVSDLGGWHKESQRSSFTKSIPLPYPVKSKPNAVRYADGVLALTFERKDTKHDQDWQGLRF